MGCVRLEDRSRSDIVRLLILTVVIAPVTITSIYADMLCRRAG